MVKVLFVSLHQFTTQQKEKQIQAISASQKKSAQSILYIPMYPTHMYPRCGSISSCCCCLYRRRRYMYRRRRYTA